MLTYVLRHGRTGYSARHRVNGDPAISVLLDEEGMRSCAELRKSPLFPEIAVGVSSAFPRARQTARLILGAEKDTHVDARLNELDYGRFEGRPFLDYAHWLRENGPWARPPEAAESQREGMLRMLDGLAAHADSACPRLIVGHGLLLSLLLWQPSGTAGNDDLPLFLPEAPYQEPFTGANNRIVNAVQDLTTRLLGEPRYWSGARRAAISSKDASTVRALFAPVSKPLEENETNA